MRQRRNSGAPRFTLAVLRIGVVLIGAFLANAPAVQAQVTREHLWITNGTVHSSALYDNALYVGGQFTRVGPDVGRGAVLDPGTGLALEPAFYAKANLPIYCVEPDGAGGWFIGGVFTQVRGQPRNNVAHFDASGNLTPWNPNLTGTPVLEMHLDAATGTLYLAGGFTSVGGQPRNGLASVDAATGAVSGFNPSSGTGVYDIAVSGGIVYVGGSFTSMAGQARNHLAALDASTGTPLAWNPSANDDVYAMTVAGGVVVVAGSFTSVGGQSRNGLAALDPSGIGAATPWNPQIGGNVQALAESGGTLYVGGNFSSASSQPRGHLAAFDLGTGALTAWDPVANGAVSDMAVDGGIVYVCGSFTTLDGVSRRHIGAIDTGGTVTLFHSQLLHDVSGTLVNEVAAAGGKVYAVGDFAGIGAVTRNNLASFSIVSGVATTWDPNANGAVRVLHLIGNTLYVGGDFTALGGVSKERLAALDTHSGAMTNPTPSVNGTVYALASFGNILYIGGEFSAIGAGARANLGSFDMAGVFVTTWNPNVYGGPVRAIRTASETFPFPVTIYIGGLFTRIGGVTGTPRNYLASFGGTTLTSWAPNANFPVYSMLVATSRDVRTIYVGGSFTAINGIAHDRIAAIDAAGAPTAWGPTTDGTVYSLSFAPGNLIFIGGTMFSVNGVLHRGVACLNRGTGALTNWNWDAGSGSAVYSLLVSGSTIFVGGTFSAPGDRYNLAAVSDGSVTAVEPSESAPPRAGVLAAPNPFLSETVFHFSLSRSEEADVALFDAAGRLVRRIYRGGLSAGAQRMKWDGRNEAGALVGSGVYFLRVETPTLRIGSKVFLLK